MSASLVGSEMCIRDRKKNARKQPLGTMGALVARTAIHAIHGTQRVLQAVSYTHLTLPTICSV
eukprot:11019897-Alexandrium_andersonii.AAC.1